LDVPRKKAEFVHLHNHSQYSLLDGASRIDDMVKLAADYGMPALAITDHGNMFGVVEFYKAAQKAGVKPIIGAEVYVAPGDRKERKIHADIPEASFHLTLLCRDMTGYRNLIRLVSYAYLEGFYYKPRIDKELLARHAEGLIGLSGCLKGEVNYFLRRNDVERAMAAAGKYQEILGQENFFLEVMRAGIPEQEQIIPGVREVADSLGIGIVATNDCHYLRPDDAKAHDALVCIQTGKKLADQNRLKMATEELFFRSPADMERIFSDIPGAVERTREIADRCNVLLDADKPQLNLPKFESPAQYKDDFDFLSHLARDGLKRRYSRVTEGIERRLEHELDVIRKMGFPGYFLVVKDIVDFAKSRNIPVGPGRGSAAGSLVLYSLGITDIDPLRYGLLFERFLTLERVSMPDVDIDFSDARRQEVIDYIRERYGRDSVAQIITFGTMQARAVVRDVGRVMDIPIAEVDKLAKLIPHEAKTLYEALTKSSELKALVESKREYQELITIARKLEGLSRHASLHASAVVIAPRPLIELVPLYKTTDEDVCTQYDMYSLESVGLLKMDVLGLRTLTVVEEAEKLVRAAGHKLDVTKLPLDDAHTYQMLQRADTVGVFQLESAGMRDLCRRMLPDRLEHIIALIALYRPGPMDLIPTYLARKQGSGKLDYEHPLLEPITRETYGILIYQEQVMQAAQALAGYTLGKADLLRRAMGKKDPQEMEAQREVFIKGCAEHNHVPRDKAEKVFNLLAKFAGYGFNKSHAAGYAFLSYITGYLKANFPVEFMAAVLTSELGDSKQVAKFVTEARRMGLTVLGPDVNRSGVRFTIEEEGEGRSQKAEGRMQKADGEGRKASGEKRIRFGLAGVKNMGVGASEAIVACREKDGEYESLLDFLIRNKGVANRKAAESLVKAGAFDWYEPNRASLLSRLELEMAKAGSEKLRFAELQASMFGDFDVAPAVREGPAEFDKHQLLAFEKEAFGFYFSSHPLEPHLAVYRAFRLAATSDLDDKKDNSTVSVGGVITARRIKRDKRDREYVVLVLEDFDGPVEVMVFADQLEKSREHLQTDKLVIIQGRVKKREQGVAQLWADRVIPFEGAYKLIKALVVDLGTGPSDDMPLLRLREVLKNHEGQCPVYFRMVKSGEESHLLSREHRVAVTPELLADLARAVGAEAVALQGELPAPEPPRRRWNNGQNGERRFSGQR